MMKFRTSALVMALALSVSLLSGCGSKEPAKSPAESVPDASVSAPAVSAPEEQPDASAPETPDESAPEQSAPVEGAVDLNAFVMSLAEQYGEEFAANANVVEHGMHADLYPGIADIDTKQLVIYQPMMGAVVCEIALAEVADAADVEAVKTIFQSRVDAQVDGGAWYPASIEGWQNNSRIVTNGNFVMMIAWDYCDEAVSAFNGLF